MKDSCDEHKLWIAGSLIEMLSTIHPKTDPIVK